MTGLGLEVIEARDNLTGYARQRYENAATQAQRGLIEFAQEQRGLVEFAQELGNDDLHVRMPDTVKRSSWGRQFKTHDRVNKRLMTGAEAAERDANNKEQAAAREARQEASIALAASLSGPIPLAGPSPPPPPPPSTAPIDVESVLDTPPYGSAAGALTILVTTTTTTVDRSFPTPGNEEEEEKEEEEEEAIDEAFIPPPSTAPAAMTQSRAGRKRAPTMKALEAEKAPKRGTGQGKARGKARGRGGASGAAQG
ncbi:hypothetical protein EPUS_06989 [Endocarpon pusillum Z07020]|uniref:Uncharacterized protein n=1 Tax=Endocarpon pusillum (strain Z07020 / HMAS-L-300199) TaxID=1263415 RepID=U1GCY9_ENDPU|nr:uncharacterized protein EPUS_06989 [Endocarpon pusillum Z07020]ERF75457.1 hypothetical protein EPUS_06989 [Endocarpon pusillum Z07020]